MPLVFAKQHRIIILMVLLTIFMTVFLPSSFAQEDNICRAPDAVFIEYGDSLTGTLNPNFPVSFFCFEAERGTDVTVTITPLTANLDTVLIIGTPFLNSDSSLADEPLFAEESPPNGRPYQGTVSIDSDGTYLIAIQGAPNVQGAFEVTLELSGGNVLLGSNTDDETDDSDDSDDDSSSSNQGVSEIIPGQTDLCTTVFSEDLDYGDVVEDQTSPSDPKFYCFEALEGDLVSIEVSIENVPLQFLIVEPLFDFTQNGIVYAEGIVDLNSPEGFDEFLIPADGEYVILVFPTVEAISDFTLTLSGVAGNVYSCQNEPLATLVSRQWAIMDGDGTIVIEINISCAERLAVSTLGASEVVRYSVTQDDEFLFLYQNRLYVTQTVSEGEWVIQREDGQEFTLQAVTEGDVCTEEPLLPLIEGSWLWGISQTDNIFFDFTCNGLVIVDDGQDDPFIVDYEFDGTDIVIFAGEEPLIFENVVIGEEELIMEFNGVEFPLLNILYDGDDATDESDSEDSD